MPTERSAKFLDLIRRSERGRLKIYLGYGPGVGKTYQMLQEAHRLRAEGIDVVIGLVETHNRPDTAALLTGLDLLPRRRTEYHGITIDEFDLDACIARKPQVAIVDELAHTNVPGSKNTKRYEDIQELLSAGIHVITALNVQHLESLYNTVESLVGINVRERVPDAILADADQVVNVDVAPEDLQKRLRDGKIYPAARIADSLSNFFQSDKLEHLRELALRELAGQIDARRRERPAATDSTAQSNSDQIMVCLSSKGPSSARLLRFGSRLAGRLNRNWYAIYVQTTVEDPLRIDARTQRLLADTLTLANGLGATVFTFKGDDVPATLVRFAREYHVGQIVIGKPRPIPFYRRLLGHRSVAERLIFQADGLNVIVVDGDAPPTHSPVNTQVSLSPATPRTPSSVSATPLATPALLSNPGRITIYKAAPTRDVVLRDLVRQIRSLNPGIVETEILRRVAARESEGSTFLNDGVALPHARVPGLAQPELALAISPAGIADVSPTKPVQVVLLLLSPADATRNHLQLLAATARLLQTSDFRKTLLAATTPEAAAKLFKA